MSKTLKKGKRGSAAETRKSFLVTETGLVETEDEPENPRRESMSQRGSTSQKMMQESPGTWDKYGADIDIPEETEKLIHHFNSRNKRRQSIKDIADAKLKTKDLRRKSNEAFKQSEETIRNALQNTDIDQVDEIKANFYSKNVQSMMGYVMTTKAIAIMSSERRKRGVSFEKVSGLI